MIQTSSLVGLIDYWTNRPQFNSFVEQCLSRHLAAYYWNEMICCAISRTGILLYVKLFERMISAFPNRISPEKNIGVINLISIDDYRL